MEPMLSQTAYAQMKEELASIGWIQKQLRAAIERGDWSRSRELTERIRGIQSTATANGEWMKYAEGLYDGAADITIDPFSPGLYIFAGGSTQEFQLRQKRAIEILSMVKRTDDLKIGFYARRHSDFEAFSIKGPADQQEEKEAMATLAELQQEAIDAFDAANLSLDQAILQLMEKPAEQESKLASDASGRAEVMEVGSDLLYAFSEAMLTGARRLGFAPVRIESRRHLAYLVAHGCSRRS